MPDNNVRIIFTGESRGAIESIQQTTRALANMETAVGRVDLNIEKMFKGGGFGQISKRDLKENLLGLAMGFEAVAMSAGGADSELAKATNTIIQFVSNAVYLGPVGIALMGIGFAIGKMTEKTPQVEALIAKLKQLGETDPAVIGLAQLAGVTEEQAAIALKAAADNEAFAKKLYELTLQTQQQAPFVQNLKTLWDEVIKVLANAAETLTQLMSILYGTSTSIVEFVSALRDGKNVQEALASAEKARAEATLWMYNQTRLSTTATQQHSRAQRELNELVKTAPQYTKEYVRSLEEQRKAQEAIIRQAVEAALTPTAVTEQEQRRIELLKEQARIEKELADEGLGAGKRRQLHSRAEEIARELEALGPYRDKWDEFRRRLEDVARNAIDPAKYGAIFANQLRTLKEKMGMSVAELAERFKDFSLFADPANLVYINWTELDAQIKRQLDALIGRHNVIKRAVEEAWRTLTKEQREALREMGIESTRDATRVLSGTASSMAGVFTDKESKEKFVAAGQNVIVSLRSGMTNKETIKQLNGTIEQVVQVIMDYFSRDDTVKRFVNTGVAIIDQIALGIKQQSSVLSDVLTGAVLRAISDATAAVGGSPAQVNTASLPNLAAGAHSANPGGMTVQFVYSPPVSLATRAEAESVIAPYVVRAIREATTRRTI